MVETWQDTKSVVYSDVQDEGRNQEVGASGMQHRNLPNNLMTLFAYRYGYSYTYRRPLAVGGGC